MGVDGPGGMLAIGSEDAVVKSCAITRQPRDAADSCWDALRRFRHCMKQRTPDEFLVAVAE